MARYPTIMVLLHWLLAILLIGMLASGLLMGSELLSKMLTYQVIQWHKAFGVAVLVLGSLRVLVRLGAMAAHKIPPLPKQIQGWELKAAHLGHLGLYAAMLAVPLAGWLMVSASPYGLPTILWGNIAWPHIPLATEIKPSVYGIAREAHELLAYGLLGLLGLHIVALIKHRFKDGINLLPRMGLK